ncbi:MAG: hypothetical protein COV48_11360 [Elusimicrobia bacterium CG11_big_fil_rev_8_21_14_0_20_64_6]|nr:MAG: hypothetical protein COV48_11360 [Elusimicrobia bacterium CG11_big_fil_rev_8_21_14_0_20_64_6]
MKIIPALFAALAIFASSAHADPFADFQSRVQADYVKPFALDLGGVLGGASAHTGRTLGFPGFWAGAVASVQTRPDKNDRVLRDAGVKAFGVPLIEVGVGLPFKIDAIVHGISGGGVSIYGGGLRYGLYRTDLVDTFLPNVSISAFGDKVNHKYFSASHGALNAVATWNLPIVKPFFLAGYDVTEVKVGAATTPGVAGTKATARGSRFSAGVDLHPLPFVSVRGAYTLRHGLPGFDLGIGAQF